MTIAIDDPRIALGFTLPPEREAHEPPEARGRPRDQVALMVSRGMADEVSHHAFTGLPSLLLPGDLLVVNNSATLPAAFITHTACVSAAQSIPVKKVASLSPSDNSAPQGGSDDPARRTATGRSLTGALRRVSLLPVRVPAETGGGGVMRAVSRRPPQTVTPAPAEFQQRAP